MKSAFYTSLFATALIATAPVYAAANDVPGGSRADECISDIVTSAKFFAAHAKKPGLIDISAIKRACEKKTGEKVRVFTSNKFAYDLD